MQLQEYNTEHTALQKRLKTDLHGYENQLINSHITEDTLWAEGWDFQHLQNCQVTSTKQQGHSAQCYLVSFGLGFVQFSAPKQRLLQENAAVEGREKMWKLFECMMQNSVKQFRVFV